MPFVTGSTPFGLFDTDVQFAADSDKFIDFFRKKLGEPVICVHVSSSQLYATWEEAVIEYGSIINAYQAKSVLSQFLGATTGSLSGSENTYPARLLEFEKRMAEPFGEEAYLNGTQVLYSGTVSLTAGTQKYNLYEHLSSSLPGPLTGSRIFPKQLFHFSPLSAFRFFGTTSAVNYLNAQFHFESFTPETIFYLLPIWEDVLRGMQFETSNRIRRSNYSYEIHNNELTVYPVPGQDMNLYITFMIPPNPTVSSPSDTSQFHGVANLSNIPFGNITYSKINSLGKSWVRRMAFALGKEVEGQIRSKFATIPIPNGDITLNGPELIADARSEMDALRQELRDILEETTYQSLMDKEASLSAANESVLKMIPLGIYVGSFVPIFMFPAVYEYGQLHGLW